MGELLPGLKCTNLISADGQTSLRPRTPTAQKREKNNSPTCKNHKETLKNTPKNKKNIFMMVFPGLSPGARSPINRGKPQSPRGVDTVDSALFAPQNIFHIFPLQFQGFPDSSRSQDNQYVGKSMKDK